MPEIIEIDDKGLALFLSHLALHDIKKEYNAFCLEASRWPEHYKHKKAFFKAAKEFLLRSKDISLDLYYWCAFSAYGSVLQAMWDADRGCTYSREATELCKLMRRHYEKRRTAHG